MSVYPIRAMNTGAMAGSTGEPLDALFREIEFRYGRIRYLANDYGVGAMLEKYGEYFEGEVALFRRILKPGDLVVSAGGNIGVHLIPLSQIVQGHGRVITFEPQAFLRDHVLQLNLDMNGCANVDVRPEALGAAAGEASLPTIDYGVPNNFGGMELRAQGPCPVPVIALDSLGLVNCDLLMLDVEGYELDALRGARETIGRCRPYLYIEIDRDDTREPVLAYIHEELDYELFFHTPLAFNPKNFAGNPENVYGNICSVMCLGVPR